MGRPRVVIYRYTYALMPCRSAVVLARKMTKDEGSARARPNAFWPRESEGIGNELPEWAADGQERDDLRRKKNQRRRTRRENKRKDPRLLC